MKSAAASALTHYPGRAGTNKCMDVRNAGTTDGTWVQVRDCNGELLTLPGGLFITSQHIAGPECSSNTAWSELCWC